MIMYVCHFFFRRYNAMYKCLYDKLKDKCNATASAIYAKYHLTVEKRWYDAQNCSISECCRCLFCIFYCLFIFPL